MILEITYTKTSRDIYFYSVFGFFFLFVLDVLVLSDSCQIIMEVSIHKLNTKQQKERKKVYYYNPLYIFFVFGNGYFMITRQEMLMTILSLFMLQERIGIVFLIVGVVLFYGRKSSSKYSTK